MAAIAIGKTILQLHLAGVGVRTRFIEPAQEVEDKKIAKERQRKMKAQRKLGEL